MDISRERTKKIVLISLFSALAYVCMFVFRIKVSFLTFDAKDSLITVAAMLLGPLPGIIISFVVAFIEYISVSDTGIYGFIMNFLSSATFSSIASFIYCRRKSLNTALISLMTAAFGMTAIMLVANIFITPFYMLGATFDTWQDEVPQVINLILPLLLPFNLTKGLFNAALVLLLYKPILNALHRAHFTSGRESFKYNRKSLFILIFGLALLAFSVVVFVVFLKGNFEWIRQS